MSNNWCDHDANIGAGLIYLDNGASHWRVTQNVGTNSPNTTAVFMTGGTGDPANSAHNNTVDHLWYQNDEKPTNGCPQYGCVIDEATVFQIPNGQLLPQPAQAIMAAAGARADAPLRGKKTEAKTQGHSEAQRHRASSSLGEVQSSPTTRSKRLHPGCFTLVATSTDAAMRWFCQAPGLRPGPWKRDDDCTNEHIYCPAATQPAQPQLAVFLPGTGLTPHGYTELLADFASHGFYTLGIFYPSTQGQVDCGMSRQPSGSTDLNCTARQRLRVLTGQNYSFGAAETHCNITHADSISNRIVKALTALGGVWREAWLTAAGDLDWTKIVIAGHSNGADNAAFAAKTFPVSRALLFAGANDDVKSVPKGSYHIPAPWQSWEGATPPERFYGFGICGTATHHASGACYYWHAGWDAQQLPGEWLRVDDYLSQPGGLAGHHRLCSNGSTVDLHCRNHMASAADGCVPHFSANVTNHSLAGKLLWTNIYKHMLLDRIGSAPNSAISPAPDACKCIGK